MRTVGWVDKLFLRHSLLFITWALRSLDLHGLVSLTVLLLWFTVGIVLPVLPVLGLVLWAWAVGGHDLGGHAFEALALLLLDGTVGWEQSLILGDLLLAGAGTGGG